MIFRTSILGIREITLWYTEAALGSKSKPSYRNRCHRSRPVRIVSILFPQTAKSYRSHFRMRLDDTS
jgi:hypothetical protein